MSMYTELHFNSTLKRDTPQSIVDTLRFMLGDSEAGLPLPTHELFQCPWFEYMLRGAFSRLQFSNITNRYYLCIQSCFVNYEGELEKFLDWIMPYLAKQPGDFLGYSLYEGTQQPTLLFATEE